MLSAKDCRNKILTGKLTFSSYRALNLSSCAKSDIRSAFVNAYDLNESLFVSLNDDSVFYKCPDRLRLPLMFYYAHTAVVYINKLKLAGLLKERINIVFETMFETGVDEMSWDDTENHRMGGSYQWPSVDEVTEYRRHVRAAVLDVIDKMPLQLPITMESPTWAILMGIDHERIHLETSSVLIRQLPFCMVHRPEHVIYAPLKHGDGVKTNPMVAVKGGDVTFGKPREFPSYGWDNEYGKAEMIVSDFECSRHMITNRQFLSFVLSDGYHTSHYWSQEGWQWVQYKQARHPMFWLCQEGCKSSCGSDLVGYSHCQSDQSLITNIENGSTNESCHENGSTNESCQENGSTNDSSHTKGSTNGNAEHMNGYSKGRPNGDTRTFYDHRDKFRYRAMFDVLDLPMDWPVEVNYHEAKAYCKWLGEDYRLPTEAEYQCIRDTRNTYACTDRLFESQNDVCNIELKYLSPSPVNLYPANEAGFTDVHGNVWQWLEDDFNGLPGFKTHRFYDDFSSPQFRGEHSVIVGGSWISTAAEASTFARYAFRRHFFQHAGFRVCRNPQNGPVNLAVRIVDTRDFSDQIREMTFNTKKYKYKMVSSADPSAAEERPNHVVETLSRDYNTTSSLAEKCHVMSTSRNLPFEDVLLVGCETGRLAFELSRFFKTVIAVDHCGGFIKACEKMKKDGRIQIQIGLVSELICPEGSKPERITFKQFTWLPNEVGLHELVIFNNLDRISNTRAYTARFPELVRPGGFMIIASVKQLKAEVFNELLEEYFSLHEVFKDDDDVTITVLVRNL